MSSACRVSQPRSESFVEAALRQQDPAAVLWAEPRRALGFLPTRIIWRCCGRPYGWPPVVVQRHHGSAVRAPFARHDDARDRQRAGRQQGDRGDANLAALLATRCAWVVAPAIGPNTISKRFLSDPQPTGPRHLSLVVDVAAGAGATSLTSLVAAPQRARVVGSLLCRHFACGSVGRAAVRGSAARGWIRTGRGAERTSAVEVDP